MLRLQVFLLKSWLKLRILGKDLIRQVQLLITQRFRLFIQDFLRTTSQQAKSKDSFLSRPTWHTTTCAGRRIQDQVSTTLRKRVKSNLILPGKTKCSSRKCLTAKTRKKEHGHQAQEHTRLRHLLRSKLQITLETTLMVFLQAKSHKVSCLKQREESFGSMKVKLHTLDRHSQKIRDLVITSTTRKRMILKIELYRKKQYTRLSIAVTQDQ